MDFLVVCICVIPKLAAAIGTIKKIAKHILLAVLLFRSTALCLYDKRLHQLKIITVNNRLVNVLENHPVFFRIIVAFLILVWFGISLEVDYIAAILLLSENFGDSGFAPLVFVRLCYLTAFSDTLFLPIRHRNQHLAFLQNTGNRFVTLAFKRHFENVTHDLCRFGINNPLLRVIGRFNISIRRRS